MSTFELGVPPANPPSKNASYSLKPEATLMDGRLRVVETFREIQTATLQPQPDVETQEYVDYVRLLKDAAVHKVEDLETGEMLVAKVFADRNPTEVSLAESEIAANIAFRQKQGFVPAEGAARLDVAGIERRVLFSRFMEHGNMFSIVEKQGPFGYFEAAKIMIELATSVQRAHELKIAHGDVTPFNAFSGDGAEGWLLGDLGAAQRTEKDPSMIDDPYLDRANWFRIRHCDFIEFAHSATTPAFSAPENTYAYPRYRLEAEDSYGLHMMLHYALTGMSAFTLTSSDPHSEWNKTAQQRGREPAPTDKLEAVDAPPVAIELFRNGTATPQNRATPSQFISTLLAA